MLCAHYLIGSYRLKKDVSNEVYQKLDTCIDSSYLGPYVLYKIGMIFLNRYQEDELQHQLEELSKLLVKTQGIKGDFYIINDFIQRYPNVIAMAETHLTDWINTYLLPLIDFNEIDQAKLFSNVSSLPKVSVTSCLNCDNRCCYDGVYVTYSEEEKIKQHIQKYPNDFKHVPTEFLEKGEWEFLFGGKRTKRVFHDYLSPDYPAHFEKTICVFALEDGSC